MQCAGLKRFTGEASTATDGQTGEFAGQVSNDATSEDAALFLGEEKPQSSVQQSVMNAIREEAEVLQGMEVHPTSLQEVCCFNPFFPTQ